MATNKVELVFGVTDITLQQEWGSDLFTVTVIDDLGYQWVTRSESVTTALGRAVVDILRDRREKERPWWLETMSDSSKRL